MLLRQPKVELTDKLIIYSLNNPEDGEDDGYIRSLFIRTMGLSIIIVELILNSLTNNFNCEDNYSRRCRKKPFNSL